LAPTRLPPLGPLSLLLPGASLADESAATEPDHLPASSAAVDAAAAWADADDASTSRGVADTGRAEGRKLLAVVLIALLVVVIGATLAADAWRRRRREHFIFFAKHWESHSPVATMDATMDDKEEALDEEFTLRRPPPVALD